MSNENLLQLTAWKPSSQLKTLTFTRFRLSSSILPKITRLDSRASQTQDLYPLKALRGIHPLMAFYAPDLSFIREEVHPQYQEKSICFYFLGNHGHDVLLRKSVQNGICCWIHTLYANALWNSIEEIAQEASDQKNWEVIEVPLGLKSHAGVCPSPRDSLVYDALCAYAVQCLSNQIVEFEGGFKKRLIRGAAPSSSYSGLELLMFEPRPSTNPDRLWSEVIRITAATFPEREEIYLLAKPSIRNWGPVKAFPGSGAKKRCLDVFFPHSQSEGSEPIYRQISLQYAVSNDPKGENPSMRFSDPVQGEVWNLLSQTSLQHLNTEAIGFSPYIENKGVYALPRLGSTHSDRFLPGGSGIGWPDRRDLTLGIDKMLKASGFRLAEPMKRLGGRFPMDLPFSYQGENSERRKAVCLALDSLGIKDRVLDIYVLYLKNETLQIILDNLKEFLGEADSIVDNCLYWQQEKLSIQLHATPSGPLAAALPRVAYPDDKSLSESEKGKKWHSLILSRNDTARAEMEAYIKKIRGDKKQFACAILEMDEERRNQPLTDPYTFAKQELMRVRVIPQVVLVGGDNVEHKYASGLRDCLRMLGVIPASKEGLGFSTAAITLIRKNTSYFSGTKNDHHSFPIAIRDKNGTLECALAEKDGVPTWMPYTEAWRRIVMGQYERFQQSRESRNLIFSHFFTQVLTQLNRQEKTILLLDGVALRDCWQSLLNSQLRFDEISIGNHSFGVSQFPNLSIIRIGLETEKYPTYYHETDQKQISGLFQWGESNRTFYGVKAPSRASVTIKFNSIVSRNQSEGGREGKDRRIPQMDEIAVLLPGKGGDAAKLAQLIHRLRKAHAQYDDDTCTPYPLHELRIFRNAVGLESTDDLEDTVI